MQTIEAHFDGNVFIPKSPANAVKEQNVLIMIPDDFYEGNDSHTSKTKEHLRYAGTLSNEDCTFFLEASAECRRVKTHGL